MGNDRKKRERMLAGRKLRWRRRVVPSLNSPSPTLANSVVGATGLLSTSAKTYFLCTVKRQKKKSGLESFEGRSTDLDDQHLAHFHLLFACLAH